MKPSDTAITNAAATIPRIGCFMVAGSYHHKVAKTQRRAEAFCPALLYKLQRFREELLLFRRVPAAAVGVASGENSAIGHRDCGLTDPIRVGFLGAYTADRYF